MSLDYCAKAKKYRVVGQAPPFRFKCGGGKKVTDLYGQVVNAWRADAIGDFYFGTRADDDPTIVWRIDGAEYDKAALNDVRAAVDAALASANIVSVEQGDRWCGYPSLVVTLADGTVRTEAYDGQHVQVSIEREAIAA